MSITIGRNSNPPRFVSEPYKVTLRESLDPGRAVKTVRAEDKDKAAPFNTVRYSIIGDNKAPSFFKINPQTGDIQLNSSLVVDTDMFYTIRVVATDGGDPAKTGTTTVAVTVQRNLFPPRFNPQTINKNVLETHPLGKAVVQVNATDRDTKVIILKF